MINNNTKELLTRGVEEVIDNSHLESVLMSGKKLRVKLGIDPTSPNIHIGRAVQLWKLKEFQDLGHHAVFIVGDFTAIIGDTSDKEAERPMLSENEVKNNMATYFEQAYRILDKNKTEVHFNSEWLNNLGFSEIVKMANLFGLHEFESREVIAKRMKAGRRVSFHELMYPLMQGYDSVAVKADIELGGTDQRFNLLAGRTIQALYQQEPQDIIMMSLLEGTDGRKMSSSWGNVINIKEEPDNMFGKVMSIADGLIFKYFRLATDVHLGEINEMEEQIKKGVNPRDIKIRLAKEIVTRYYGIKTAKESEKEFNKIFSDKELPTDIPEWEGGEASLIDILVASKIVASKTEVKRLIEQKGITINDKEVKGWNAKPMKGDIIRVGHRKFLRIK